ncbi:LysR family transcriptional regulator [Dysgonomonas sp. ZJ709]|uniref:LysR family transcriptional regulator n=1 Tax=Dysgonomonas sp. ZJ709 TaxID=2709797 RepID=UPI0013E9B503|nr:LysR family transcriptional regulator [Dysgonomonas sp. ZJ709]
MVNFEWYRTFKAIYQAGNLTKASHELLISQPNVSVQLAALENHVGHKLFGRLPRRLVPTEYGKLLYTQIVESVENLEKVETEFRKSALKRNSTIRLGSPIEFFNNYLVDRLGECKSNLNVEFALTKDLIDCLVKQELDFVIATQQIEKPDVYYLPIMNESFMIVADNSFDSHVFDNYISDNNLVEAEKWLIAQAWITYDNELSLIRRFWRENFNKRPLIKPHYVIPDINIILKAVSLGNGISVVSDLFIDKCTGDSNMKILWRGIVSTTNTLFLAYNPLRVEASRIDEMKNLLALKTDTLNEFV